MSAAGGAALGGGAGALTANPFVAAGGAIVGGIGGNPTPLPASATIDVLIQTACPKTI